MLKSISKNCVAWVHQKGFHWLKSKMLPCLLNFVPENKNERNLLSDCFYVLGDIYDFNNAPLAAIKAYKKAIFFDKGNSAAYREIGSMFEMMGNYSKAEKFVKIALKQQPDDKSAQGDYNWLLEAKINKTRPLYKPNNVIWKVDELLADGKPQKGLELLKFKRKTDFCLARARCYGALNDSTQYLHEWSKISCRKESFELQYSDWFFMPQEVECSPEIWVIFQGIVERMKSGIFISYDSFYKSDFTKNMDYIESYKMVIQFQINRHKRDLKSLKELHKRFPFWDEVKSEIKSLEEKCKKKKT